MAAQAETGVINMTNRLVVGDCATIYDAWVYIVQMGPPCLEGFTVARSLDVHVNSIVPVVPIDEIDNRSRKGSICWSPECYGIANINCRFPKTVEKSLVV